MSDSPTQKTKTILLLLGGGIALCVLLYLARVPLYNELNALKLIPEPEPFTELYFDTYPQDPSQVTNGTTISFSFTIHNVEGTTTTYPYLVYVMRSLGTTTIDEGVITLADNASSTISEAAVLSYAWEPGEFIVLLPTLQQHIDFYVPTTTQP